ncbi:insulinase family protein [Catenovulum sediminis]|uniref:Protease 3 n=1 Tax=Catenovulum sediminis TaxID=1740262 RepID=A0ABV1RIN2_9ALTE
MFIRKCKLLPIFICSFILTACLNTPEKIQETEVKNLPVTIQKSAKDDRDYRYLTLANGMQVILISDDKSSQAVASLAVGVGSFQNPQSQPGLAHFVEHMLFLGTEKYPEPSGFFKFVETRGGFSNAYTATDHTNYYFSVNKAHFAEGLDRFSDYFKNPTFAAEYVEKERIAVDNEWTKNRAHDGRILQRVRGATGNPAHPLSRINVGNLETLKDKPGSNLLDESKAFFQQYYSANIMNLVLAGPWSLDQLETMAKQHFSSIKNKAIQKPQVQVAGLMPHQVNQHIYYQPQQAKRLLLIEFYMPDNTDSWRTKSNEFIRNLLTSEEPGTLGEYLRLENLAVSSTVMFSPDYYGKDGYVQFQIELTEEGNERIDQIVAATLAYIDLVKRQGIQAAYYDELKSMAADQFANQNNGNLIRSATHLSYLLFEYPPQHVLNAHAVYEKFDPESIKQTLSYLNVDNMRLWHIHPQAEVEQEIPHYLGKYAHQAISTSEKNRWLAASKKIQLALPKANELFSTESDLGIQSTYDSPQLISDQNGIEAWLMHSQAFQNNQGWLDLIINTDSGDQDAQYKVAARLFINMFEKSLIALRDKAGRAGISIDIHPYWGGSIRFKMQGKSAKHAELSRQLLQALVDFEASPQEFAQSMLEYQDKLKNRALDTPAEQANTLLTQLLFQAFTDDQLLEASRYVSLKMVNAFKAELLQRNRVLIFAYGAYTDESVRQIAADSNSILPDVRQPIARYKKDLMPIHKGEMLSFKQKVEHSDSAVMDAFVYPKKDLKVAILLEILNARFHNEFFRQLRTEEQLGYQVGSMAFDFDNQPIFLLMAQSNNSDYKKLKTRFDKFRQDFASQISILSAEDFEQTRKSILAQYQQDANNIYEEAQPYFADFMDNKLDFDSKAKSIEILKSVKVSELQALYQNMLLGRDHMELLIQLKGSGLVKKS